MRCDTLHIGIDDTDSPEGMCTTYLAYKMVGRLRRSDARILDYPRLVRFNPNIPWKTRGNGAVSITVRTDSPDQIKAMIIEMVREYSDTRNGANPGAAFYADSEIPESFGAFSELALWRLVPRGYARSFAAKNGIETFCLGNGQGLVGAIGAIGYRFGDSTVELLAYRRPEMFGRAREIDKNSVRQMQRENPDTFSSYDDLKDKVLMAPRGPDPVLYGLRGESPRSLCAASGQIRSSETPAGYMIFRSNQATGDHLKNPIPPGEFAPYTSGIIEGVISDRPRVHRGGHVFFSVLCEQVPIRCAIYRSTGLAAIALGLMPGDSVRLAGGVRPAGKRHGRVLNVESVDVLELCDIPVNPRCSCGKSMKSMGRNQGYRCARCGTTADRQVVKHRSAARRHNIAVVSAHRHLTRPEARMDRYNEDIVFDELVPWYVGSGE